LAKSKTLYSCNECGGQTLKWQGQCPHCQSWNTLIETVAEKTRYAPIAASSETVSLSDVKTAEEPRIATGISELDRVLGGGLVAAGVVLLGGDPGIGKSTLLLQALAQLSERHPTLYVSGEESAEQTALRAKRLSLSARNVRLLAEIQLEKIEAVLAREKPAVAVIDSIQTLYSEALQSAPGSVAQVRECAAQLTRHAKRSGTALILVGHVTKEGALAGPRVLEHIVDTVLYFEGDTHSSSRLIRAIKNRFGAANELGIFAMTDRGLRAVANPSALFLSEYRDDIPGSCVLVTQEGTRPLLVEIQALVDEVRGMNPRRVSVGLDQLRLSLLLAVLHQHAGISSGDSDVFVNAVGGVKISEPAADLAVLAAIVSAREGKPLPPKLVVFGEVGLTGEVRPVQRGEPRIREAAKLGFTRALIPRANKPKSSIPGIEVIAVDRISAALAFCRGGG
jgi:DNA repair protein RadA/Sms